MPNPVAVNDLTPISGSLQTSRISYGVETAGKNYGQNYNGTTWYSDIPNGGEFYTIISDNYTANYYISRSNAEGAYVEGGLPAVDEYSAPVFWTTVGTSSLDVITIVNGLPDRVGQIPFNSGSQALNWIASSSNYFAVGPDYYAQIDADGLVLYLEGNQVISYPTTGSTWYDLSGYDAKGTLINGTTWNSDGWFIFDGTDDYVNVPDSSNLNLTNQGTISVWINPATVTQDSFSGLASKSTGGSVNQQSYQLSWRQVSNAFFGSICNGSGTYNDLFAPLPTVANVWYNIVFTWNGSQLNMYNNGVVIGTTTQTINNQILATDLTIGGNPYKGAGGGDDTFNGKIANVSLYNKGLSASEVLQNYYGGPIVTGSITGLYNAGNLVSFAPGTTATYNMVSNTISGSLQNGVLYSPTNGGYWRFDGADDRILLEGSTQNAWILNSGDSWTVNAWVRVPNGSSTSSGLAYQGILSNTSGGPIYSVFQIANGTIAYSHYNNEWLTKFGTTPVNDGNWHLLTWVNQSNSMTFYVDSIPNGTVASNITGIGWLDVIGSSLGTALLGDIASLQINKEKAFTAAEVQQQYNATK
jgi:hypothetical protein